MKNKFTLVVAIIGLAFFASCESGETAQTQDQQEAPAQQEVPAVVTDSTMVDSTTTK